MKPGDKMLYRRTFFSSPAVDGPPFVRNCDSASACGNWAREGSVEGIPLKFGSNVSPTVVATGVGLWNHAGMQTVPGRQRGNLVGE